MLKTMKERCQELLPVIQGGAEGKVIQRHCPDEVWWTDCGPNAPVFDQESTYRVKPEPKYRPFTAYELIPHIGRTAYYFPIASQPHTKAYVIKAAGDRKVYYEGDGDNMWDVYSTFLQWYRFEDGTPCGVLVNP